MTFDLAAALKAAQPGDTIQLPPGSYGDVVLRHPVRLVGPKAALFNTVTVLSDSVTLEGFSVAMAFGADTKASTAAVRASKVFRLVLKDLAISGPIATSGVAQDAVAFDDSHNVIGLPTGRGIALDFCTGVLVSGCEITQVMRGVTMAQAKDLTVEACHVHHTRGALIDGSVVSGVKISGNRLNDVSPWRWGRPEPKDHADFIHLWTQAGSEITGTDVEISGNLLDQGAGSNILGILIEDNSGLGFQQLVIADNTYLGRNSQGIAVENGHSGSITGNELRMTSGRVLHDCPSIYLRGRCSLAITGNTAHDMYRTLAKLPAGSNTILPNVVQTAAVIAAARARFNPPNVAFQ